MDTLQTLSLPKPIRDEETLKQYALRMKGLRLKALQSDPDSWISRYDNESSQPLEFWINRLRDPNALHIVMVKASKAENDSSSVLQDPWVAFLVLVDTNRSCEWFMAAVYLDKSLRGRGFGKKLVQAAITTIAQEKERSGCERAVCTATVRHGNDHPLELYKKLGFKVIDPDAVEEKDGKSYHTTTLRLDS